MRLSHLPIGLLLLLLLPALCSYAGNIVIKNNPQDKTVVFGNDRMQLTLDYNGKCVVSRVDIRGQNVVSGTAGIFSAIRTAEKTFSSAELLSAPRVICTANSVQVSNIRYGDRGNTLTENWKFTITETDIVFDIERSVPKDWAVEEVSFPAVHFNDINTWNAAFLGNGGVAWFYLFNEKRCTYGVHTDYSAFWNNKTDIGLKIKASAAGKPVAFKYSRSDEDQLVYSVSVSDKELTPRYDADTKRRRFIRQKTDVWDAFVLKAGKYRQTITLTPTDYAETYRRGKLVGIDGAGVSSILNTIARIGVIDSKHYGANSWHTPYGPICLHEQYIGQLGIAINDPNYLNGYKECLNFYRDNTIKPDGRVFPRWAYDNSDMMPGEVTPLGFYEAQWGYLFDSNTDLTINVCEVYHQSGDIEWVRTHKNSCENTLEYLLRRDVNHNHLVEMTTDSHSEKRGSDWIDIIWASFENALVNAKLYYALTLWSDVERQLGDHQKAAYYADYATQLKNSFNKSIEEGGFWDNKNKWYVYWRDKDNSIHGNNLVTPVNFMAIAYGICDYPGRRNAILNKIESQMNMERLFFWPICLYPFQTDEGLDYQYPFPYYENGDLFLSWGCVGVESYAKVNPDLALKYVENILKQYDKDGLAFQRYARTNQEGAGDDILAGNCLSVVGLYKAIYGINPRYNRLYLDPHLPAKLSGTELAYHFRNELLKISLETERYSIAGDRFKITSNKDFGFYAGPNELLYFDSDKDRFSIAASPAGTSDLSLDIQQCEAEAIRWTQTSTVPQGKVIYTVGNLEENGNYSLAIDGKALGTLTANSEGFIRFEHESAGREVHFAVTALFAADTRKAGAPGKNILRAEYKHAFQRYTAGGKGGLFDGLSGSADYRDGAWQGFEGDDMDVTFELKQRQKVNRITAGFLERVGDWIYLPVEIEVYVSTDGETFKKTGALTSEEIKAFPEDELKKISVSLNGMEAKYIRVVAKNIRTCPAGDPGAGGKAWVFCDEVGVE